MDTKSLLNRVVIPLDIAIEQAAIFCKIAALLKMTPDELSDLVIREFDEFLKNAFDEPMEKVGQKAGPGVGSILTGSFMQLIGNILGLGRDFAKHFATHVIWPLVLTTILGAPLVSAASVGFVAALSKHLDSGEIEKYIQNKLEGKEYDRLLAELKTIENEYKRRQKIS